MSSPLDQKREIVKSLGEWLILDLVAIVVDYAHVYWEWAENESHASDDKTIQVRFSISPDPNKTNYPVLCTSRPWEDGVQRLVMDVTFQQDREELPTILFGVSRIPFRSMRYTGNDRFSTDNQLTILESGGKTKSRLGVDGYIHFIYTSQEKSRFIVTARPEGGLAVTIQDVSLGRILRTWQEIWLKNDQVFLTLTSYHFFCGIRGKGGVSVQLFD